MKKKLILTIAIGLLVLLSLLIATQFFGTLKETTSPQTGKEHEGRWSEDW